MRRHIKALLCCLSLTAAVLYSGASVAGEFFTSCYADISCSDNITDLVTDRFTTRFPVKRYEIVAYVNSTTFGDGQSIAYAAVGVVPRMRRQYGELSLFPASRYSVAWHGSLGSKTLQIKEIEVLRAAVIDLMKACAKTKNCNIIAYR